MEPAQDGRCVRPQRLPIPRDLKSSASSNMFHGHHPIPALIALRIGISFYLRHMDDPEDTLRVLIADLNAALAQKLARAN
jgi:hypothetical protein